MATQTKVEKQAKASAIPRWIELLHERGISDEAIEYCGIELAENQRGFSYPCQYPSGEVIYRYKGFPGTKPRYLSPELEDLPDGEPPPFYTPNYEELKESIRLNMGVCIGVEGEPDLWVLRSLGVYNVIAIIGVDTIPDDIHKYFSRLGIKVFMYYPDIDLGGWNAAQRFSDLLTGTQITYNPRKLPKNIEEFDIKDVNDLCLALNMDVDIILDKLAACPIISLITPEKRIEIEKQNGIFDEELYQEICARLGVTEFKRRGFSNSVACIFTSHKHDHNNPAAAWNADHNCFTCLKCGKSWNTKETAEQLGIDWHDYVKKGEKKERNNGHDDTDYYNNSNHSGSSSSKSSSVATPLGVARTLLDRGVDYKTLNPSDFMYSSEEAIDLYLKKLKGEIVSEFPPLPFPFKSPEFDALGGFCKILPPRTIIGFLGVSGGFKCLIGETLIQTRNGLIEIGSLANGKLGFTENEFEIMTDAGWKKTTHFYDSGICPTITIIDSEGNTLTGTFNHPIRTLQEVDGKYSLEWTRLDKLKIGDTVPVFDKNISGYEKSVFFNKIVSIEESGEQHCYDVTIPDGHAFLSNGFVSHNTSILTTMTTVWQKLGFHGITISPEWGNTDDKESFVSRMVQMHGGVTMTDFTGLNRHYYEEKHGINDPDEKFGSSVSQEDKDRSEDIALTINNYPGKMQYVSYFGADIFEFLAMTEATYYFMDSTFYYQCQACHAKSLYDDVECSQCGATAQVRYDKPSTRPSYIIFDYLQMFLEPHQWNAKWDINKSMTHIKALCLRLNVVGIIASQVTKSDGKDAAFGDKGKNKYGGGGDDEDGKPKELPLLDSYSGLFLRDDQCNLFMTANLKDDYYRPGIRRLILYITKNSMGQKKGEKSKVEMCVDEEKMAVYPLRGDNPFEEFHRKKRQSTNMNSGLPVYATSDGLGNSNTNTNSNSRRRPLSDIINRPDEHLDIEEQEQDREQDREDEIEEGSQPKQYSKILDERKIRRVTPDDKYDEESERLEKVLQDRKSDSMESRSYARPTSSKRFRDIAVIDPSPEEDDDDD